MNVLVRVRWVGAIVASAAVVVAVLGVFGLASLAGLVSADQVLIPLGGVLGLLALTCVCLMLALSSHRLEHADHREPLRGGSGDELGIDAGTLEHRLEA